MKLVAFWTRNVDAAERNGRLNTARSVRDAMREGAEMSNVAVPTFGEASRPILTILKAGYLFLRGLVTGQIVPLQCLIFCGDVSRNLGSPDLRNHTVAYFDGIRHYFYIKEFRQRYPECRVVIDFDDLMFRRMEKLLSLNQGVSLGFFADRLPKGLGKLLNLDFLSKLLLRYEAKALRRCEAELAELADAVVLVSSVEVELLRELCGKRAQVFHISPPVREPTKWAPFNTKAPYKFVFVGSDAVIQNRTTIDALIELWTRHEPKLTLHVYGRQTRAYLPIPGVRVVGEVADLLDVYDGSSVLICPTFLAGGVKTKVWEALAYGAPVVGNELTFEGLPRLSSYLVAEGDEALRRYACGELAISLTAESLSADRASILATHGIAGFKRKWIEVLEGGNNDQGTH